MARNRSTMEDLHGKRAVVMGLGTRQGGVGVARFLAAQGAAVTVTDLRDATTLEPAIAALAGLPIRFVLGEHRPEDFDQADIVVRNPGVPADSPWIARARRAGARIEMEMSLFFRACPAPIIAVTGTKGKTTTATMCAAVLRAQRSDTVLAGNMGRSALDLLERIEPDTPVVLELSSWQIEGIAEHQLSPHVAVWTNLHPDHLNRYPSMDAYAEAKRGLVRYQSRADWFVANRDDPIVWESRAATEAATVPFGVDDGVSDGAFLDGDRLIWRRSGDTVPICDRADLPSPGPHTAMNALAATAAALLYGADIDAVRSGLRAFEPIAHRQERVAEIEGVTYVNDTAATTPAAVLAALDTFRGRPLVVIAGGAEKGVPLAELAQRLAREAAAVVLLDGTATPELQRLLTEAGAPVVRGPFDSMERAVEEAAALAPAGGVVLLSPGCASFGLFRDEFHRGQAFRDAVDRLSGRRAGARAR